MMTDQMRVAEGTVGGTDAYVTRNRQMDRSFDGFVIKNVFQPLADKLAPRVSAFNIARFFCDGVLVLMVAIGLRKFLQNCPLDVLLLVLVSGFGVLIYRMILWLVEIEWNNRSPHQGRRFFMAVRLLTLAGLALSIVRLDLRGGLCFSLLVCSAYFSSCALKQST